MLVKNEEFTWGGSVFGEVSGGNDKPGYKYYVESGALPGGLTLDKDTGKISGTLEAEGDFTATFKVEDGGCTGGSSTGAERTSAASRAADYDATERRSAVRR